MENSRILATCAGALHAIVIFCTVYPNSVLLKLIRDQLHFLRKTLVLINDILCRNI